MERQRWAASYRAILSTGLLVALGQPCKSLPCFRDSQQRYTDQLQEGREFRAMARRRPRQANFITVAALLLQPASGFYALSRRNARTVLRSSSSDPTTDDDTPVPVQKALAAMTAFSNRYVKVSGTKYCSEPSVPAVVIRGLAEHKAALGAPLCPCRNYVDKEAEAKSGYWNCPCVPMRGSVWKSNRS